MTRSAQSNVLPVALIGMACWSCATNSLRAQVLSYPETRRVEQVDDYHGTRIADPYRWLEDVNAPAVSAWVAQQNEVTFGYLERLPVREAIARRMARFFDDPRMDRPVREGGRTFWTGSTGRQDHAVLHVRDGSDSEPRVLIDPNTFSADGSLSLSIWAPSPDGTLLAWGIRDSGSDWQTFRVRDVATGRDLADTLRWIKFSEITWTKDGAGFFYSRYDQPRGDALTAPNVEHQLFYHRVGTPQSEDMLIVRSDDHPDATLGAQITDDGRHVLVHQYRTRLNQTLVLDLGDPTQPDTDAPPVPLFSGFEASYSLIGSDGSTLYILTNDNAPMMRIVAVDVGRPERVNWRIVIREAASVIAHADIIGGRFVVEYLEDAKSVVRFFSMAGDPVGTLDLPGPGTVTFGPPGSGGFSGNREDTDFFYTFQTFVDPGSVLRYDFETGESTVHHAPTLAFDASPYITEQVFYTSRDGTRIPMFIVRREDLAMDGSHPVMLYGYGGFGAAWPPAYAPFIPAWLEMGGIWAWPNLRGGSEYGRAWHEAGMFGNKQNVFDDFIAAGEYLVAERYTIPERLAIHGASNGGLLVGAVMAQRPDLFRVALPDVGLYDMLRYHTFVAGHFGLSEYGSSETPEGFDYLRAYSPLHNVETGTCYPATLVTTADHEDRVPPLHSYKFVAALQAAQKCDNPVLLRVDTDAGHGFGMPRSKAIAKYADMWAFAAGQLGMNGVSDTVHVAPPTGAVEADRANVQAAFDAVQPGGTVRFASGTYLLGAGARLTVPDVTVLGHPDGTVLRGCDPEAFKVDASEVERIVFGCTGLYVQAERQTIRGLTFEYAWHGIVVGPYPTTVEEATALGESGEPPPAYPAGGQRIEGNIFRATPNGLRVLGTGEERSVVRDNDFIDVFHAIGIYGAPLHFLDNRVTVAEPERVPSSRHPGSAVIVSPGHTDCAGHVVAGNRIEGYPDPIYVLVRRGEICRGVEIRDNTIRAARVNVPEAWGPYDLTDEDSTMVGVPITLMNRTEPTPGISEPETVGILEDILVQGNQIIGAEGLGILVQGVSRSRIVSNTIAGIQRRTPFPGITWDGYDPRWEAANGSGIWVSPGSDGNEVVGNTFEDVAAAVVIEGDSNRVELQRADDAVRDLGTGNRVTRAAGVPSESDAPVGQALQAATSQEWTDASPHEVRFVTVAPDVRLEVLDWGGDGLPLVFLAGANFNAHSFDDFAPRFTGTHRVLGITRRGHGASSWPDSGYDLPTLVEDIRVVLDGLGIDRAILAGHSMAGAEMTVLATESPDRVAGLIYIDAGHDPTDIGRLRVPELCSFGAGFREAMERTFENPELVRRTQWYTDENGARRPFVSTAGASIDLPTPDYSGVVAPALGIYYVPERTEDVFMGLGDPSPACVAAFHRYIHGGIAAFTEGLEQATVIALSDTNHNIHLASPDALEAVMRRWLAALPEEPAGAGGHHVPVRPGLDATPADLDRFAEEVLAEAGVRDWALAVIHEGRPVERRFSAGVGGAGQTVNGGTMFDLQSVAKPVIAWGVMHLVRRDRRKNRMIM